MAGRADTLDDGAVDLQADDRRRLGPRAVPAAGGGAGGRSRVPSTTRACCPRPPQGRLDMPPTSGFVQVAGRAARRPRDHAAGRRPGRMDSTIDPAVGVILHKKVGDAGCGRRTACARCS